MASEKQRRAARRNVRKAQAGAKRKQTLKRLPKSTRTALGKEGTKVKRGAKSRHDLYREAQKLGIEGRSKMGKEQLKRAVARAK
jgi:hypothetical protein